MYINRHVYVYIDSWAESGVTVIQKSCASTERSQSNVSVLQPSRSSHC